PQRPLAVRFAAFAAALTRLPTGKPARADVYSTTPGLETRTGRSKAARRPAFDRGDWPTRRPSRSPCPAPQIPRASAIPRLRCPAPKPLHRAQPLAIDSVVAVAATPINSRAATVQRTFPHDA